MCCTWQGITALLNKRGYASMLLMHVSMLLYEFTMGYRKIDIQTTIGP
jgi:hypothetical protein